MTAAKSHKKHGKPPDSPEGHGRSLLNEAAGEWPAPRPQAKAAALESAADEMGIDWP